ncbi:alpha/beta fold hydrolase [Acidisphaera sp. L21]|uniref:alpha/beta fold hydrolase n=1 Tax=Acidisphaera sp. L21 TaxID=1641851 RepID=UPI00131E3E93|nr:alpha/beta hydrolase [Acidisphaera sp. L21]
MPKTNAHDGVALNYEVHDYTDPWKNAPVLLLQHGFGRSSRFWYNMIPYLSRFYRVVCPDLRGLGQSSRDFDLPTGITVDNYVADLVSIADAVGARDFHYAGESLGGIIGMALAAHHPDRVRTLSLLAAPLSISPWTQKTFAFDHSTWQDALRLMGSKGWAAAVNTATRFPSDAEPGLLEWYGAEMGKSDVEVMIAMSRLAAVVDATPLLENVRVPVLGLYPSGGRVTGEQEAALRAGLTNFQLVHLSIATHMIWTLAPATCADHILHFMAAHDGVTCREL